MRSGENIYKRKDGRWEGRYIKDRTANGKLKYGYIYGKTIQEVRSRLLVIKKEPESSVKTTSNSFLSFQDWAEEWIREIEFEVKPATLSSYSYKLKRYILPCIGQSNLREIDGSQCEKLLINLKKEKLSDSSIRVIYQVLNKCMKMAYVKQLISINPLERVKPPKVKKKRVRALSVNEQRRLEEAALAYGTKGLPTILSLYTGLRIGEIAALKWEDVDLENNYIYVKNTFQRVPAVYGNSKTLLVFNSSKTDSSERIIPIGRKLHKLLQIHRGIDKNQFVFATNQHPTEPRVLTNHFHQIRQKAGLKNVHFHQLRHTFATRCLERNGDISSVSALLGHASTQMTLDTYADALLEQRIKVIASIE